MLLPIFFRRASSFPNQSSGDNPFDTSAKLKHSLRAFRAGTLCWSRLLGRCIFDAGLLHIQKPHLQFSAKLTNSHENSSVDD